MDSLAILNALDKGVAIPSKTIVSEEEQRSPLSSNKDGKRCSSSALYTPTEDELIDQLAKILVEIFLDHKVNGSKK